MENKEEKFRKYYGQYYDALVNCKEIMNEEINSIISEIKDKYDYRPVEHLLSRIKDPDSLQEKLLRRNAGSTLEDALNNLSDIIGFRIVTHFIGDIYQILDLIKKSDKWKVHTIKDYILDSKPNGYRSLHLLLEMPFNVGGIKAILTEIQMRTIAMDCWAALEHQLKYKKEIKNVDLITKELKRCADDMASTDLTMESIKKMIHKG